MPTMSWQLTQSMKTPLSKEVRLTPACEKICIIEFVVPEHHLTILCTPTLTHLQTYTTYACMLLSKIATDHVAEKPQEPDK